MRRSLILLGALGLMAGLLALPAAAQPATHTPIAGEMILSEGLVPGEPYPTPSGMYHERGGYAVLEYTGDITGDVTFSYKRVHIAADGSQLVSKGPFEGEVTWDGRTGMMKGMFTTTCKAEVPFAFDCSGVMVGHGSGDLDGVKFHTTWGDGWFPFDYEGTALDTNTR